MTEKFQWSDSPSQIAFPVARAGYPFIYATAFATAVFALLGMTVLALLGLLVAFCICMFFRDPDRVIPTEKNAVVSPADGKVVLAGREESCPFFEGPCMKVSIFMSVLNVHVNRVPREGTIKKTIYHPGKFFNASFDKASVHNERNAVVMETPEGATICFVQIAGLIARRIVCAIQEGDQVKRGQRMGLICFGSRVDVYLPPDATLNIGAGEKAVGGSTVIGYLADKSETE